MFPFRVCAVVIGLLAAWGASAAAQESKPRRFTFTGNEPVSLNELVGGAAQIFEGVVEDLDEIRSTNSSSGSRTLRVTLAVKKSWPKSADRTVKVELRLPTPAPVKIDDHVLWFLTTPDEKGVSSLVGYENGHFGIRPYTFKHRMAILVAENVNHNVGLWADIRVLCRAREDEVAKSVAPVLVELEMAKDKDQGYATMLGWLADHKMVPDGPVHMGILTRILDIVTAPHPPK